MWNKVTYTSPSITKYTPTAASVPPWELGGGNPSVLFPTTGLNGGERKQRSEGKKERTKGADVNDLWHFYYHY